jgi:hypothetical protein
MVGRAPTQGILWLSDELAGFLNQPISTATAEEATRKTCLSVGAATVLL